MTQKTLDAVIIGAGPYGLSIAAYFRCRGITFRIFGRTMDSWLSHMPQNMYLKSDGFASNICDPKGELTLRQFCAEQSIPYADTGVPISLKTFTAYGLAFKERMVPTLEEKLVSGVDRLEEGFLITVEDGETLKARRVIMAVGITHFEHLPASLAHLPADLLSHSRWHSGLEAFRNRKVVVLGGGASALDIAGLLHQGGAEVQLVARRKILKFHSSPTGKPRSLWQQMRHPQSGLGPGLRSRFFADAPLAFSHLPSRFRLWNVRRALGPSGGWFSKNMVVGKVSLLLGHHLERAEAKDRLVHLHLRDAFGGQREVVAEHVIAATGYKVGMEKLAFLSNSVLQKVRVIDGAPVLSSSFESSVPGLYFVGIAAANRFGPVMRFAFGARFAAKHLTHAIMRSRSREKVPFSQARLVRDTDKRRA